MNNGFQGNMETKQAQQLSACETHGLAATERKKTNTKIYIQQQQKSLRLPQQPYLVSPFRSPQNPQPNPAVARGVGQGGGHLPLLQSLRVEEGLPWGRPCRGPVAWDPKGGRRERSKAKRRKGRNYDQGKGASCLLWSSLNTLTWLKKENHVCKYVAPHAN